MSQDPRGSEFIELLTQHELRLRVFALSIIPHWADAQEVVQLATVKMWQKFSEFDPGTSFYAWACRIIHLTGKDYRRRQRREKLRFDDDLLDTIAADTVALEGELVDREDALANCIAKLKDKQRQILHLRYQQNQTIDEIAGTVGVTGKAIYQSLSRMYKSLSDCVERQLRRMRVA